MSIHVVGASHLKLELSQDRTKRVNYRCHIPVYATQKNSVSLPFPSWSGGKLKLLMLQKSSHTNPK